MNKSDVVDLPQELQITEAELAIDVFFLENEAFLHCVDRTIKGKTAVPLRTTKKAKGADLLEALKKVVRFYNKADVTIKMIHADNEFRAIEEEMEDDFDVEFNFAAPYEHVPDIKQENRTIQESFRAEYHRLPFKVLPKQMILALIARCTKNRNLFVQKGGCSDYYSPHVMLSRHGGLLAPMPVLLRHPNFRRCTHYFRKLFLLRITRVRPQEIEPTFQFSTSQ